ncbi:MAG TPA: histidine kinase [Aliiroseovarius sp.]|nr:histidine kinase [Aliiroseovarius sp.]
MIFGGAMYYMTVYAYYEEVGFHTPPAYPGQSQILLTSVATGAPEEMVVDDFRAIDASSSPLKFRACFTTPMSIAMLSETYKLMEDGKAEPLTAPSWFDCFDAGAIGKAIEDGEAVAFLSQSEIRSGADRVVAVFPDGRGYAWHQLTDEYQE